MPKNEKRVSGISAAALRGARAGETKRKAAKDARTVDVRKARQITRGKSTR